MKSCIKNKLKKVLQQIPEIFLELFFVLTFMGVALFHFIFKSEDMYIYVYFAVIFGVIFVLQSMLLFLRWVKIDRKKYITEKIILFVAINVFSIMLVLILSHEYAFSLFLLGLGWCVALFAMYVFVIFLFSYCKKIIQSKAHKKCSKVFLIFLVCAITVYSLMFIGKKMNECKEQSVWEFATFVDVIPEYQHYLEKYPNGKYTEEAVRRITNYQQMPTFNK